MKKVLVVFGTRPEAIKLCPLVIEMRKHLDELKVIVCVTAQHREMLDQVLNVFNVEPDYDLNLMRKNQSLFDITTGCLINVGKIIEQEEPDMLIAQGDTTTTISAMLAAYYYKVKVGHVEAGLRTNNKYSPFPEEMNRRMSSVISDLHFAPTQQNKNNLLLENIPEKNITITGNTVIDALFWVRNKIMSENRKFSVFDKIDFEKKIILVTGHRRENIGARSKCILSAIKNIALKNKDVEIVFPVHKNPNVVKNVRNILNGVSNIKLIEPLEYESFVYLMDKSYFIITDSGGIQEEAPSLGKPVLLTRDTTERPEAVEAGIVKLVGYDKDIIIKEAQKLLDSVDHYKKISSIQSPYGDGSACRQIVQKLFNEFNIIK